MSRSLHRVHALTALALLAGCDSPGVESAPPSAADASPILQALGPGEETLSFACTRDASVRGSAPNANFGAAAALDLNRSLIGFDAAAIRSALGPNDAISSARLELPLVRSALRRTPTTALAYRMTQSWSEAGVTWNCASDSNTSNAAKDCTSGAWSMDLAPNPWATPESAKATIPASTTGKISFDLTTDVRNLVSGQAADHGWLVRGSGVGERDEFSSRESSTPPRLLVSVRRCSPAACDDSNPCTVDACDASAQCTHTPATNGTSCTDGNACTQNDSCRAGSCTGSAVVCVASDACHAAGSCDPQTGTCSRPIATDGTSCNDGDACTQTDTCVAGACVGSNLVSCPASDACHPATCNPGTGSCSASTACTFYGQGSIPANAQDGLVVSPATLQSGTSNNQIGGLGSAIAYTGVGDLYLATPDRGPNDGNDSYSDRYYQIELSLNAGAVAARVVGGATLKREDGVGFSGLSSDFDATNSPNSRRLDPEGLRVGPGGTFFVSDEYGPFLYEFGADGKRSRSLPLPNKYLIDHPSATAELPPANSKGRQLNRGMEGLAISPDGTKLYGMLQNPLIQDGALDASNKRIGLNVRLLELEIATGATRELLYPLSDKAYGLNEILAVDDHRFLVIERDGNAGSAATWKKLFLIDIAGASDVSSIPALPTSGLPSGVTPVQKRLFLDLLAPEYGLAGASFPEKIEGLTFGRDLPDGRHALIVTNDNDFLPANASNFYVFAIGPAALPGYTPGQASFPDRCAAVSCSAASACTLPGTCSPADGSCSQPPAAAGTPAGTQTPGDCRKSQCDGAGQIVQAPDDADAPDDGNACTADSCSAGSALHTPLPAGTVCNQNGGTRCDGAGACVACVSASDCPGNDEECSSRSCQAGVCGRVNAPAGTPLAAQQSGDCARLECDGQGQTRSAVEDQDLPVDGNPCTSDVCSSGVPSNPPVAAGTSCGANQTCTAQGVCAGCASAGDCPGVDSACAQRTCTAGACGFVYTNAGTPLQAQVPGDCRQNQCDGQGSVLSAIDDADLPIDANSCTSDVCTQGVPSHANQPAGTSCSENGGQQCNASGQCVALSLRVVRIGAGAALANGVAAPGFIEERKLDGSLLGTVALPTSVSGSQRRLTLSGTASSEGALSLSADGRYLTLVGYDADVGTTGVATTAAATINRVVGRVDAAGVVDTSTTLNNAFEANNVRGATSVDGSAFWVAGNGNAGTAGVQYVPFGGTSGTRLLTALNNARTLQVFGGQLYGSASSGTFTNVFSVGSGTPSVSGQTATPLPGMPTSGASPYGFALLDRNPNVPGLDTLYVADDGTVASGGGVQKWSYNGSTWTRVAVWTSVTGVGTAQFRGLVATVVGSDVYVLATTSTPDPGNRLVLFVDNGGAAPSGSVLATAASNTAFRGLALSPHP